MRAFPLSHLYIYHCLWFQLVASLGNTPWDSVFLHYFFHYFFFRRWISESVGPDLTDLAVLLYWEAAARGQEVMGALSQKKVREPLA